MPRANDYLLHDRNRYSLPINRHKETPVTELLVREVQRLSDQGQPGPTLRECVLELFDSHPAFAVEVFVRDTDEARGKVFEDDSTLDPTALAQGDVYASPTVFQLKAMLYHGGILTKRGAEPHRLDPIENHRQLRQPL